MGEPLSAVSGTIAIVMFACQSSQLLYKTISSFQSSRRTVRELREELEALERVLNSLQITAAEALADLTPLELPLRQCGNACRDFDAVIIKCAAHAGGPRTSFRDWATLKYMGDDIAGFKTMLAGYKSTLIIALGDINMRTASVTQNFLVEFKQTITNTTSDLDQHLEEIDSRLQALTSQGALISDEDVAERQKIQEERNSAQQCLDICKQVYRHLDQSLPDASEDAATILSANSESPTASTRSSAQLATTESFKACKETINHRTTWLEKHLREIDGQLRTFSTQPMIMSNEQRAEKERLESELDSVRQCLEICTQASRRADQQRSNVFEDVSMADDGHQVLVSTVGDLILAKRVTAGSRSMQLIGQMSDASLQHFSMDRGHAVADKVKEPKAEPRAQFEDRYGEGLKLSSENARDVTKDPFRHNIS